MREYYSSDSYCNIDLFQRKDNSDQEKYLQEDLVIWDQPSPWLQIILYTNTARPKSENETSKGKNK